MAKTRVKKIWRAIASWLVLFATVLMIGALPILSDFTFNHFEVAVQDLVLPLLGLVLIATVIASLYLRLFRRRLMAGFVATLLAGVLLTNNYDGRLGNIYPLIASLIPLPKLDGVEACVFSLVFIALILVAAHWIGRLIDDGIRRRGWNAKDIVVGALIAITISFLFVASPAVKTIAQAWPQYFYKPPALSSSATDTGTKPDIYYIVLEDYANQTQLTNQFGFTNADFSNFLTSAGYYLNPNAHQNYPYTTMSIASTLNAGYNTDMINKFAGAKSQTIVPYHRAVQYSSVAQTFKNLGYSYDEIGTWYETTNRGPLANNFYLNDRQLILFNHTNYINGYTQNELAQSLYWRFLGNGVKIGHWTLAHYQGQDQIHLTTDALAQLKSLVNQAPGGRFIFAHLIIPHEPYNFNADGSLSANSGSNNTGQPIKQKYLGQLQYINNQIEPILSKIKQNSSGQAVVILQSDEGPQPQALNDHDYDQGSESDEINHVDMRSWNNDDINLKYGTMVAYNIPGVSPADLASGANHLNIFRLVLDHYFDARMPFLPECYYAYPDGRGHTFVYDDITARISGAANPACSANGTNPK